jgi:hypothetical protein
MLGLLYYLEYPILWESGYMAVGPFLFLKEQIKDIIIVLYWVLLYWDCCIMV